LVPRTLESTTWRGLAWPLLARITAHRLEEDGKRHEGRAAPFDCLYECRVGKRELGDHTPCPHKSHASSRGILSPGVSAALVRPACRERPWSARALCALRRAERASKRCGEPCANARACPPPEKSPTSCGIAILAARLEDSLYTSQPSTSIRPADAEAPPEAVEKRAVCVS